MIRCCGVFIAGLWSSPVFSAVSGAVSSTVSSAVSSAAVSGAALSDAAKSVALVRPAPASRVVEGFDFTVLGQLLAGLVLVLLIFMGLAWLVRRTGVAGGFSQQGLRVVATLPLSTRERVVLVQAGSQQLLLGVAPGRVNLLQSFEEPLIEVPAATHPPFAQWLQRAKAKAKSSTGDSSDGAADV
ncbi:MAG: flagellar protein FliO/FliZ [Motiliproteus sp.]